MATYATKIEQARSIRNKTKTATAVAISAAAGTIETAAAYVDPPQPTPYLELVSDLPAFLTDQPVETEVPTAAPVHEDAQSEAATPEPEPEPSAPILVAHARDRVAPPNPMSRWTAFRWDMRIIGVQIANFVRNLIFGTMLTVVCIGFFGWGLGVATINDDGTILVEIGERIGKLPAVEKLFPVVGEFNREQGIRK